ncbi:putative bifunctional diguanylate cyclase/phosphodiesterase [endosymbiont of Ridgeia piscesae]|uniref:cyclic-guanylate-specific phosphodiesterase n=1 Tax=endosymbiont of Ridgeia piscesae TaxID=54398 RepID=A0A0T5Z125_9GAMM|nr:GGDEF and EAL domain-containing protein [endosymbiont of Ridgeia piscesae]KRT56546.1 PAS domain S-box/diguanylate cyclase (GGDEF) domain [endosymbiont of Ridgeia piscesae]KRT58343.1 response regulator receiver modulated diguanylate cyclase/phosphodiesterase [endosymbiont of Ridgeia piscesae]
MNEELHRLLTRQLRKLSLSPDQPPEPASWQELLSRIDQAYHDADQDRYTLERSLTLSSEEMQTLYQRQKSSYETRLHAIVGALHDLLFLNDEDGLYLEVLTARNDLLYRPAEEIKGKTIHDIFPPEMAEQFLSTIHKALQSQTLQVIEYNLNIPSGSDWFEARIMPTELMVNGKQTVICLVRDISELRRSREALKHMATHDPLTGQANRKLFEERLDQALSRATRTGHAGTVMFLDLDRFKIINDSLGHAVGDELLKQVTGRLKEVCRTEDTIARLGGDEFALLIEDIDSKADAEHIADKILQRFSAPFFVQGHDLDITASIGITLFPLHGNDGSELIRQADATMYSAKNAGRNCYRLFSHAISQRDQAAFSLERQLRRAIVNDELFLEYQPQFRLSDGQLTGLEALVRWRSPGRGLISPGEFIPIAETSGLIDEIGLWVFHSACEQAAAWDKEELEYCRLAINISRRQLMHNHLGHSLAEVLAATGARASRLECEITESAVIEEASVASHNLLAMSQLGLQLAIDDFGTGHASLANLKRFPLNRLKIDRTFVNDVGRDPDDEAIIRATVYLAHGLGLEVIAEGVENEIQKGFLRETGCDEIQGYLCGRPMPVEQATALLRKD